MAIRVLASGISKHSYYLKKPKVISLIKEVKRANQYLAKLRILIEHKIGLIKLFKMVSEHYHNRKRCYNLRMRLFSGIVTSEKNKQALINEW